MDNTFLQEKLLLRLTFNPGLPLTRPRFLAFFSTPVSQVRCQGLVYVNSVIVGKKKLNLKALCFHTILNSVPKI